MALNDIFRATIGMNVKGQKIVNVLHLQQTSADGALAPNKDVCAAIIEDLLPTYQACCSNDLTFESVRAHKVSPAIGGTYVEPVAATAGTVAQDTLPPNSAVVATLYSVTYTRQGRGRIFMSGVPDTFNATGCLTNAASAIYVTFLNKLLTTIQGGTGATFTIGVWSTVSATFHQFTSHELRAAINTLRSRRMENP